MDPRFGHTAPEFSDQIRSIVTMLAMAVGDFNYAQMWKLYGAITM